jgi:hypothetical protein
MAAACVSAEEPAYEKEHGQISREHSEGRFSAGVRSEGSKEKQAAAVRAYHAEYQTPEEKTLDKENSLPVLNEPVGVSQEEAAEEASKGYYYTSHMGAFHCPADINTFFGQITLEDGSLWSVKFGDTFKMANWLKSDSVVIVPNGPFSYYKYRIVNQDTFVTINANLVLTPYLSGPYTYNVLATDYIFDKVWLNDGSVWEVSPFDNAILQSWKSSDIVIIGINDDYLHDLRPNVLINTFTNEYVRATCTFKLL